jgi:DNA-binding HxlR family transcriptional regulator
MSIGTFSRAYLLSHIAQRRTVRFNSLARDLAVSPRWLSAALKELEREGLIEREEVAGPWLTNSRYRTTPAGDAQALDALDVLERRKLAQAAA